MSFFSRKSGSTLKEEKDENLEDVRVDYLFSSVMRDVFVPEESIDLLIKTKTRKQKQDMITQFQKVGGSANPNLILTKIRDNDSSKNLEKLLSELKKMTRTYANGFFSYGGINTLLEVINRRCKKKTKDLEDMNIVIECLHCIQELFRYPV
ncbi:MAG: hypothetical protein EZS28_051599 [Streblomastix strix]|uniref:Formin GTPase-binding domain-containing protein n=1 Tax=Streblomastix strix TaxID=222440 RepID=A0A5J4T3G2_9EUKA|nr:MAG: hypothetical protein EZS28_051599 [Streblomastix strix]